MIVYNHETFLKVFYHLSTTIWDAQWITQWAWFKDILKHKQSIKWSIVLFVVQNTTAVEGLRGYKVSIETLFVNVHAPI